LLAIVALSTPTSFVPLFIYRPTGGGEGETSIIWNSIRLNDVTSTVSSLAHFSQPTQTKSLLPSTQQPPRLILAIIYSQLSGSELSQQVGAYDTATHPLSFLKAKAKQHDASSVYVPQLSLSSSSSSSSSSGHPLSDALLSVFAHSSDSHTFDVTCENFLGQLQGPDSASVLNQGPSHLVILRHSLYDHEGCVERVVSAVDVLTDSNYVLLISADSSPVLHLRSEAEEAETAQQESPSTEGRPLILMQEQSSADFITQDSGSSSSTGSAPAGAYQYPGLTGVSSLALFVLLMSVFLVFLLFIGVTNTMSIESPPRFALANLNFGKEN